MPPLRSLLALFTLALFASGAKAHFVWLERTPDGAAAFFGEWSDNVRETQDGYLKGIAGARAFAPDGAAVAVTAGHDRFAITSTVPGDLRFEAHYRPEKGETLIRYYARHGTVNTGAARLALELVPVNGATNTFALLLDGKPVPDAEVTLFSATGWTRKFKTGAEGRVTVETPWSGDYVLEAAKLEKTPGRHEGREHTGVRHVTTLFFNTRAKS